MELSGDEDSSVRLAAFNTIVNLMEVMDSGESPGGAVVSSNPPTL